MREKKASKTTRGQEKKGEFEGEVIKNKRPLNTTHIFPKKEKQLEVRITRRVLMMSQIDDDEEKETLQKKQVKQEDTTMRGNINPQQVVELLKKQHHQHQRQKEISIYLKYDIKPHISPKQEQRSNGQEHQRWPKKEPKYQTPQPVEEQTQDLDVNPPKVQ